MGRVRSAAFISIVALAGCIPINQWHEESYFDQRAYQHNDAAELRGDLERTIAFLPTIGLKRLEEPKGGDPATEAVFIRHIRDHFHVTVTVRGLVQVTGRGWSLIVRVDSYDIGEEGAIVAGQTLLKEIDHWHQHASNPVGPTIRPMTAPAVIWPSSTGYCALKLVTQPVAHIAPSKTDTARILNRCRMDRACRNQRS